MPCTMMMSGVISVTSFITYLQYRRRELWTRIMAVGPHSQITSSHKKALFLRTKRTSSTNNGGDSCDQRSEVTS